MVRTDIRHTATSRERLDPLLSFALIFAFVFLLHSKLLRLPYFWDEAGYYVPAARDLLLTGGGLIPHSTLSNAHPPLVMAYLALCWRLAGYSSLVTRSAMLLIAAFALLGLFRLAQLVANAQIAVASTICTTLYPVFFVQSSLAQLDVAAAGLTFWGMRTYLEDRRMPTVVWFSLAALAKETAIIAPAALFLWELGCPLLSRRHSGATCLFRRSGWKCIFLLSPVIPLGLWYAYHGLRTGYVFGNPEFFRYNVQSTLNPLRVLVALGLRLWQTFGHLHLYFLTVATVLALWRRPLQDRDGERRKIQIPLQLVFLVIIVAYVVAMSVFGGAVLARYMLPAVPLVIVVGVSTLWRRARYWKEAVAIIALTFAAALFIHPTYGISIEDNLAYRDYIVLHQNAETFLEARHPMATVLTAWPASDELTRPYLGYVNRSMRVLRIEDFTVEQIMSAAEVRSKFNMALVFSTRYEPPLPLHGRWEAWDRLKARFFGFHRDLPPAAIAQLLGGHVVFSENRPGQWVAVIEIERAEEARFRP